MIAKFDFRKLDSRTRALMVEEIKRALESGNIYYSSRFNDTGNNMWVELLISAATNYDEHWLAYQLEVNIAMKQFESRETPLGGYTIALVPHSAAGTLADGQFNRFYMAGICRRALEDGRKDLTVYRAKQSHEARPESNALEGSSLPAASLLDEVRSVSLSLKCKLLKPNSGLSIDY